MIFFIVVVVCLTATYNLALASFAWQDTVVGLGHSIVLVAVYRKAIFPKSTPESGFVVRNLIVFPRLFWMLVVDILKGTWQVVTFVVGIRRLEHPGIVKIPLGTHTDIGVGIVGHLVTVSPGSFVVDIDLEQRFMLVHYIDASDPDKLRADVEKYYRLWENIPNGPTTFDDQLPAEGDS